MRSPRAFLATALAAAAALVLAGSADAAIVTIGPSLTGSFVTASCTTSDCTLVNAVLDQSGANVVSPVSGVIVRWNVIGGETAGTYRLRTVNQSGSSFFFAGSSAIVNSVPSAGIQTFPADLPITAGQEVGIDMSHTASIGTGEGGDYVQWEPVPADGTSPAFVATNPYVIGFNAEVQPAPTITALGTTSGSTAGGTSVTIAGTDLEGASAVSFGGASAASFSVDSESQITAVAPAGAAGSVPISVTTVAGTATSAESFAYVTPAPPAPTPVPPATTPHCVVPKLKGKKLKPAKKALIEADCKVGKVKRQRGVSGRTGRVVKQSRNPRTVLPAGGKVTLTVAA